MEQEQHRYMKRSYWLLIGLGLLQVIGVWLAVRHESASLERDKVIDQRTAAMVDDIFPELFQNLSVVSQKASEIGSDVRDIKQRVSAVDERLGQVGRSVDEVGAKVEGVRASVTGFFDDKKGLIWGHSLNPYVLIALLVIIALSIPAGWLLVPRTRKSAPEALTVQQDLGPLQTCSVRLDRLHALLEKINARQEARGKSSPEMLRLVQETERLIRETREELALISLGASSFHEDVERNPDNLH